MTDLAIENVSVDFGGIHAYHGSAQHRRTPSVSRWSPAGSSG